MAQRAPFPPPAVPPAPSAVPDAASFLEAMAAQLRAHAAPAPAPTPAEARPAFTDVKGYAQHIQVSLWKVRQLCQLGLPHTVLPSVGNRKTIRIEIAPADAWLRAQNNVVRG